MRKFLFPVVVFSAIVAGFASCQKESPAPDEGPRELHFIVKATQNPDTKTTLTFDGDKTYTPGWSADDVLGAFLGTTTINKNAKVDMTLSNTVEAGPTATFEGSTDAEGSGKFVAFYPAGAFDKGYDDGGIGLNIGATSNYVQYPTKDAPDPTCNILVSKECDYVSDGTDVLIEDLFFTRPLSVLKVNLVGSYAANEEVSFFKMSVTSGTLSGRVKIDLSDASIMSWPSAKSYVWAEYSSSKPAINQDAVYLIVNPTTIASGTTVTVEAETENYTIEKEFTLTNDMSFPANGIAVLNLSIAESNCTPKGTVVDESYALVTADDAFVVGGKYVFALKDGNDGHYEFINNKGTSNTIDKNALTVSEGGVINNPDEKYVFTAAAGGESGSFKFNNSAGNYIFSGSSTTLNTNSSSGSDWVVSFLSASSTYKIQSTNGRYVAHSGGTDAKAYAISNFKDQVKDGIALAQYAGAISVFKLSDSRPSPGMSWSAETASASLTSTGVVFNAPTLNKGNADVVSYTSENTAIATIDASGEVSVLAEGTTIISAIFAGNGSYCPATVSYTLTVTDNRTQVATPTFTPAAGEVTIGTTVEISCIEGATIHYTTDGSTPTSTSATYSTPIQINEATTIKAIAFKDNYKPSDIATAAYTVIVANTSTEENPYSVADAFTLAGKLSSTQSLADVYVYGIISKIRYQYNEGNQNISFNISANGLETDTQQIYAYKAVATSASQFEVGDAVLMKGSLLNYQGKTPELGEGTTAVEVLKVPTISAESETFTESASVTITAAQGATIYYTTNGDTPTTTSSVYSAPLTLTQTTTVKAIAQKGVLVTKNASAIFTKDDGTYTVEFLAENMSKGVSAYTGVSFSITDNNFTLNLTNFNNNNKGWNFVKAGGKNGAYTGTITTAAAISKAIQTVTLTIDAITDSNVTSIKLYSRSSSSSGFTEVGSFTKATGDQTVTISNPAANMYYKIEVVCTKGSSNGLITLSKLVFSTSSNN